MKEFRFSGHLALGLSLALSLAAAEWPELTPGREVEVPWEGMKNPLRVRLPGDYDAARQWPVVFHYHGSGGVPTIDIPLAYTGGDGFILVGMEYVTRDLPAATPDYLEREWAVLLAVRAALAGHAAVNTARTYVGGFSQGGWFASEFMEVHGRDLAGAYVLGAGKRPRNRRVPKPFGGPRPVYLGAGQLDPNYIYAVQGLKHFGSLGGVVTFEDYLGLGHRMPMPGSAGPLAPAFSQWWKVEAAREGPMEPLRAEAAAWQARVIDLAKRESDPLVRWLCLSRARRAPFYWLLAPAARDELDRPFAVIEKSMTAEMAAQNRYFSLIQRELAGSQDGDAWRFFRDQARRYHALWQAAPQTYHGRRAAMEFARLRNDLSALERWRFPTDDAKTRALDEAANNPLPEPPPAAVKQQFDAWRKTVDAGQTGSRAGGR